MQASTVEESTPIIDDFVAAISSGRGNRRIKAPNSCDTGYQEDFC